LISFSRYDKKEECLIGDLTKDQERLNAKQVSDSQLQQNFVQEAVEYYFLKDGELSHEDKQHIIRSIV
jgi:hypothetical protein